MLRSVGRQSAAVLAVFVCAGPVALMVVASFRKVAYIQDLVPTVRGWTTANYEAFFATGGSVRWIGNSLLVAIGVTALMVLLDLLAGFAFAKLRFLGRNVVFVVLISTMMLPFSITLIPTYLLAVRFGLADTYPGLILPPLCAPLGVYLMRQFIRGIPDQLLEAARIDGASNLRILLRIIIPLCGQPMAVLAVVTFVANWNSFVWPLLIIQSDSMKTLTVGIATTNTQFNANLGGIATSAVVSMVPMAMLFILFQRFFVRGLLAGALKS